MKVNLDELETSLEGLKNILVEHSKRSPGFLTVKLRELQAGEARAEGMEKFADEAGGLRKYEHPIN